MFNRRLILTGMLSGLAAVPALAQGKKSSGNTNTSIAPLLVIAGNYVAYGRNPDGSEYEGLCEVVQQGTAVEFTWTIGTGNNSNGGSGTIDGRVVTVDWGDDTPVVYVVMDNGQLHGTWAAGTAFERLTPS